VEPVTHTLVSVALARAGLKRVTPRATPLLLAAGLIADADSLSIFGGPAAWLEYHYGPTHSLIGSVVLAAVVAGVFWWFGRKHPVKPVRFWRALVASAAGVAVHLLLDIAGSQGVELLWPFRQKRYAWDLVDLVDPWILALVALGLLLPGLFRLVTEEIGAKPAAHGAQRGAIAALVLLVLYVGARDVTHHRAMAVLESRMYRGATPLSVGAFPSPASLLVWHAVVETEYTLEQIELSVAGGAYFDPDRSLTVFKPEASSALDAARQTASVRALLDHARFPAATVMRLRDGWRVTVRDLRDTASLIRRRSVYAEVEVDMDAKVKSEKLHFGTPSKR
jgi:inner membrane protein